MTHAWTRRRVLALAALLLGTARAGGGRPTVRQDTTLRDVLALFDRTPVVILGEVHGVTEIHAFLRALITTPAFGQRVHTIVVEFGNARLQALADDYVLDQRAVTPRELRSVWRETTQAPTAPWDAPVYAAFFTAVRDANRARPAGQPPIRVLLGDPPIDWAHVQTRADTLPFLDRDGFLARTVESVLVQGQRALVVCGLGHAWRTSPPGLGASGSATDRIEARFPGRTTVVMPYLGVPEGLRPEGQRVLGDGTPRLLRTASTALGRRPADTALAGPPQAPLGVPGGLGSRTLAQVVDTLLVLGDPARFTLSVPAPALYQEPAYRAELRRLKRRFGLETDPVMGLDALNRPQRLCYYRW